MSHPTRVRGLKHWRTFAHTMPARRTLHGCVDWNITAYYGNGHNHVAPYTGAWIETHWIILISHLTHRRTLHGCVDWNITLTVYYPLEHGRTLHGCMDWNGNVLLLPIMTSLSHPWIETVDLFNKTDSFLSHFLYHCMRIVKIAIFGSLFRK